IVVKFIDNNNKDTNEITLLAFGEYNKHILMMKYINNHNNTTSIERDEIYYAIISGKNNNLFIIYCQKGKKWIEFEEIIKIKELDYFCSLINYGIFSTQRLLSEHRITDYYYFDRMKNITKHF
ncbi:hypothetical protein RFI_36552, partial [Reticulomyxa filosa]